jgi:parvulin-like peptidyl-prolyl isomerase
LELIKEETQKVEVTSQDIEKFYNDSKDRMKEDEERQIREIVVPAEQDAKEVLIQLLQGEDFATIAKARSVSKSAKDGGDMGFIKKGDKKNDAFDRVAFSETLETGKISGIFKTTDGYVIIKLEAKRGGKQKSLSEMWDDIKTGLTFLKKQQKVEELINRLSEKSSKEYYEGEIR